MRYLKLYEDKNISYQNISYLDWSKKIDDIIDVNEWTKKEIKERFTNEFEYIKKSGAGYIILRNKSLTSFISICEYPDDWYYVNIDIEYNKNNYYKCDQLEGLINLINDKIIPILK